MRSRSPAANSCLIALLLLCFSSAGCHAQRDGELRRSLFGVLLDAKTSSLLAEVEQLYGMPVREEWLPADRLMAGTSKVADDGAPLISINPSDGRKLDVILHELYHFTLRSRGYPVVLWEFPPNMNTEVNRASFELLRIALYDPILHYVFYPEVRASFGINPGENYEQRIRKALDDGSLASTFATIGRGAVALNYFKFRLEVVDRELSRRFLAQLESASNRDGIELGERLERIVRKVNQPSPTEVINLLIGCLNLFYERQFRFEQHQWTSRQLGKHIQQIAPIELKDLQ